jgi:hypothetical protein
MPDLERITNQEAAKLFLDDTKANIIIGGGCCILSTVLFLVGYRYGDYITYGVGAVTLVTAIVNLEKAYTRIRDYIESPGRYISLYHNKKLKE